MSLANRATGALLFVLLADDRRNLSDSSLIFFAFSSIAIALFSLSPPTCCLTSSIARLCSIWVAIASIPSRAFPFLPVPEERFFTGVEDNEEDLEGSKVPTILRARESCLVPLRLRRLVLRSIVDDFV